MHKRTLWYDQANWPYAGDRRTADGYAAWVRLVPWKLFGTFTFAWKVFAATD